MADYFARVELHGAAWPTAYEGLHRSLKAHGFTNCIPGAGGSLKLPSAFYYSTDRVDDVDKVTLAVKGCADATGYKNEVVVVKSGGWQGYLSSRC
jgi:hypothetical protein